MAVFHIEANGTDMGCYHAATASEALDTYAKDAGYSDYLEVVEQFGDETCVTQIDTDRLSGVVSEKLNAIVMQDAYGWGVALVNGRLVLTWDDMAHLIGRKVWEFEA